MRLLKRWWNVAAIVSIVGWAGAATAQVPVCPQPDPSQPVYSACAPGGRFLAITLLSNLAIDQLLRTDARSLERQPGEMFASMVSRETAEEQVALADWLGRLQPVKFTRLDTATGMVRLDLAEEERSFAATITIAGVPWSVALELPERIEGGYWRTPAVLQIALWKGRRVQIKASAPNGTDLAAEIECAVMSADGIRLITAGTETPDILVRFDACN